VPILVGQNQVGKADNGVGGQQHPGFEGFNTKGVTQLGNLLFEAFGHVAHCRAFVVLSASGVESGVILIAALSNSGRSFATLGQVAILPENKGKNVTQIKYKLIRNTAITRASTVARNTAPSVVFTHSLSMKISYWKCAQFELETDAPKFAI
jgi:hypothetical protein